MCFTFNLCELSRHVVFSRYSKSSFIRRERPFLLRLSTWNLNTSSRHKYWRSCDWFCSSPRKIHFWLLGIEISWLLICLKIHCCGSVQIDLILTICCWGIYRIFGRGNLVSSPNDINSALKLFKGNGLDLTGHTLSAAFGCSHVYNYIVINFETNLWNISTGSQKEIHNKYETLWNRFLEFYSTIYYLVISIMKA